jgi:hypothetical protein
MQGMMAWSLYISLYQSSCLKIMDAMDCCLFDMATQGLGLLFASVRSHLRYGVLE